MLVKINGRKVWAQLVCTAQSSLNKTWAPVKFTVKCTITLNTLK